jgi:CRP/FNR family cyclic AMP-dependent transcriptional regulator
MSIDDEYELLSRLELFESLEPVQLKRLIFVSQRYQLEAGEYLFRQGDTTDTVFGILDGECSVLVDSAGGEINIAQQGVGELVGEMAAISGEPRNASIKASTACEVIGFESELFINTVINSPPTALKMMRLLSGRLTLLRKQLEKLINN